VSSLIKTGEQYAKKNIGRVERRELNIVKYLARNEEQKSQLNISCRQGVVKFYFTFIGSKQIGLVLGNIPID
jgi:hypothetical protein